jgi:hypothetical protein
MDHCPFCYADLPPNNKVGAKLKKIKEKLDKLKTKMKKQNE